MAKCDSSPVGEAPILGDGQGQAGDGLGPESTVLSTSFQAHSPPLTAFHARPIPSTRLRPGLKATTRLSDLSV